MRNTAEVLIDLSHTGSTCLHVLMLMRTTAEVLIDLSHTGSTYLYVLKLIKPSFKGTKSFTDITSATAACNHIHKIMFEVLRLSIL